MKKLILITIGGFLFTSCVSTSYTVTDNEVGTKVGVAKTKPFKRNQDFSISAACHNGGITKVGTVEYKSTVILFWVVNKTTVTGE